MMPIVDVSHISKKYKKGANLPYYSLRDSITNTICSIGKTNRQLAADEFWAIKDISFTVNEGDVVGIIGRNGAGKSTLLKIISRITPPTTGQITLRGRVSNLLEVGTGFHPELTGRENIYLNGAILGMTRKEIKRKFDAIVDFSEIEKFLEMPVKHYSSGMYMRLAFAVAAHLESEILLVDEVLAVGDVQFQKKCLSKMGEISRAGRTVFFVSHNLSALQSLCTKGIFLAKGQIESQGNISKVIKKYYQTFVRAGESSMLHGKTIDRVGTGVIQFRSVRFFDKNRRLITSIKSGDPLTIKLDYVSRNKQKIDNVNISLAINNMFGQRIAILNNKLVGSAYHAIPEIGSFTMQIQAVPLVPGRYDMNLFLEVNGEVADWLQEATFIMVEPNKDYKTESIPLDAQGSVYLPFTINVGV